ncbi:CmcJ/NvfI family oxidoreductase [Bradyrhizobium sp. HKCCYLS2038]|uniref:CmcJ/NvfI family oxidoreductase n=1 Tax=unclassified Bradyrhizobium TaxID=2631580 RepID=UPI003EB943A4
MEMACGTLYYSAPLTPGGREDNWHYDAVSDPPNVTSNFLTTGIDVDVTDLRSVALRPTLDVWGFEKLDFPTGVNQADLSDSDPEAINAYCDETTSYLKAVLGADEVVLFDTVIRHKDTESPAKPNGSPFVAPYMRVHVDQNPRSALARLKHHVGFDAKLRRFQILNVWRPLVIPVRNYPLALCDYQTLNPERDLISTRRLLPEWMHELWVQDREGYSLKHHPNHRWYYWRHLTPDEAIVFKCHDSASISLALGPEGRDARKQDLVGSAEFDLLDVSGVCPHTAFFDPLSQDQGHLRSSVDVRMLALYNSGP